MSTQTKDYGVIVGVDGSPASNAAVCWAVRDAVLRHVPLTLVHVMNPAAVPWPQILLPEGFSVLLENQARMILEDAVTLARDTAPDDLQTPIESDLILATTVPTLVELSKRAELVVVGNAGRGALARGALGSISSSLARHAHCPVVVVRDEDLPGPASASAPVLVGIDGSPAAELAAAIAFDEASRRRVDVIALHAWSDREIFELPGLDWPAVQAEEERLLAEGLAGWSERYPDVTVHRRLVCDRPARALVETSESAGLAVVGSHGRGGVTGMLLGSVSNAVIQSVRIPVIVARQASG